MHDAGIFRAANSRRCSRTVQVGSLQLGGGAPVRVQSMTNTPTEDVRRTIDQIKALENAGCEIVRVAVPTLEAVKALPALKSAMTAPLVADIHFDYRLALEAINHGADKIRINPGNIGKADRVREILREARVNHIPVRIGVNAGSLEKGILRKHEGITAGALAESALKQIRLCEDAGFEDLVVSIKASSIRLMVEANRILAGSVDYPLHLGVTEAGAAPSGIIRSAVGLGILLDQGIGDTIRVSLTGEPVQEVATAYEILKSLGLRRRGLTVISCPTCGRTHADILAVVQAVEKALGHIRTPLTVAVMGCAVNGPGEAREADIGVACGPGRALLFRKGCVIGKISEDEIVRVLVQEVNRLEKKQDHSAEKDLPAGEKEKSR
ncbi:MAG TPA: flavodoxin-dependent (E)-4-hydroxy-3-methylbut-2-enyl-diphosphate synthase [bacterium]|nr:flavodoxin-dependent (E)-4-hydroxy-3-methylbut-2-enyl-diphosphate synthase [bacterium]